MAMTNAERQRRYRERHLRSLEGQAERINLIASVQTKAAIDRLANYWQTTRRAALERAIREAESRVLDTLPGPEQNRYLDRELTEQPLPRNATNPQD